MNNQFYSNKLNIEAFDKAKNTKVEGYVGPVQILCALISLSFLAGYAIGSYMLT